MKMNRPVRSMAAAIFITSVVGMSTTACGQSGEQESEPSASESAFDQAGWRKEAQKYRDGLNIPGAPQQGTCGDILTPIDQPKQFRPANCENAAFIINSVRDMPSGCVADSDTRFFYGGETAYSLCLDYNWTKDSCLAMGSANASAAKDCKPTAHLKTFRPARFVSGTSDSAICNGIGFSYPNRKMVVCVSEIS